MPGMSQRFDAKSLGFSIATVGMFKIGIHIRGGGGRGLEDPAINSNEHAPIISVNSNIVTFSSSECFDLSLHFVDVVVVAQIATPRPAKRSVAYGHTGLDNGPSGHGP